MRKPKFEVGQFVYVSFGGEDYNQNTRSGKIKGIRKTTTQTSRSSSNTIEYLVSGMWWIEERYIYGHEGKLLEKGRKKAMSGLQSSINRSKKRLEENKTKLAKLEEELRKYE